MERKKIDSKLMLFTLVLILIVLLLLNWLLGSNRPLGIWDYDKIDSAANLVHKGTVDHDREFYYILESIVQQYLNSFLVEENSSGEMDYTEYYNYLTKRYRNHLTQKEYDEVAYKFLSKFYVNAESEYETMNYMDTEQIINNVYKFEDNVYLCELKGLYTGNKGYIAIALDQDDNRYNIVYIE